MPLAFAAVCELLDECHSLCISERPLKQTVESWFAHNRSRVDAHDTDIVALLSTLLPEKRPDRVYFIQAGSLEKIIGRGLALGASRIRDLIRYRQSGSNVDLAGCVESILKSTPSQLSPSHRVTVEEIDALLNGLAARIKFSSPAIRATRGLQNNRDRTDLQNIYRRLSATEAKWLTRMVLKDFAPLSLDENLIFRLVDPCLPAVLKVRQDFACATQMVQSIRTSLLPNSSGRDVIWRQLRVKLKPQLGAKGSGRMSVEDKIDGEYCQIHVDLAKGPACVQIFSKSGKDSTEDRRALHPIVQSSLKTGTGDCTITKGCILEGELVVYSDLEKRILPFHKIRNHVTRRGLYLGTDHNSPPRRHDHLMIIYYDILLLDDESLLHVRHSERIKLLESLVEHRAGWAETVKRRVIDFGTHRAASDLRNVFAEIITSKQEGLVIKPDEPYFDLSVPGRPRSGRCIKLKKEYIGGMGDIGDFAVVGAGYDAVKAMTYRIPNLKWTHFFFGNLSNKTDVQKHGAKPRFTVIGTVELNQTLLTSVMEHWSSRAVNQEENTHIIVDMVHGISKRPGMSVVFTSPMVFDMRCFSFVKDGNSGLWMPRFPVVTKVHFDRDYMDTITFHELQDIAQEAVNVEEQVDSQENLQWIAKLEAADPRGVAVDAVSQQTRTTMATPSPRRSTQSSTQSWSKSPVNLALGERLGQSQPTIVFASPNINCSTMAARGPLFATPTSKSRHNTGMLQRPSHPMHDDGEHRPSSQSSSQLFSRKRKKCEAGSSCAKRQSADGLTLLLRSPLGEISDINPREKPTSCTLDSGQGSLRSVQSEVEPQGPPGRTIGDAPVLTTECHDATQGFKTSVSAPCGTWECTVVVANSGQRSPQAGMAAPVAMLPSRKGSLPEGCTYSGKQCKFAQKVLLLAPYLDRSHPELASLLDSHGLETSMSLINERPATEQTLCINNSRAGGQVQDKVLLVDSLNKATETETVLKDLIISREKSPHGERDMISVYDWRILQYMTILEDETIRKKCYDGFKDPWRRWYCGSV